MARVYELTRKADKLMASARSWAEDADFFRSTYMAELARDCRIESAVAQAEANQLLCPAKPAR
jgi:hypothetical protein